MFLAFKAVRDKLYEDLKLLPLLKNQVKDFSIYFLIEMLISANRIKETYDSILVIMGQLTKMVNYELVKVKIDAPGLVKSLSM